MFLFMDYFSLKICSHTPSHSVFFLPHFLHQTEAVKTPKLWTNTWKKQMLNWEKTLCWNWLVRIKSSQSLVLFHSLDVLGFNLQITKKEKHTEREGKSKLLIGAVNVIVHLLQTNLLLFISWRSSQHSAIDAAINWINVRWGDGEKLTRSPAVTSHYVFHLVTFAVLRSGSWQFEEEEEDVYEAEGLWTWSSEFMDLTWVRVHTGRWH